MTKLELNWGSQQGSMLWARVSPHYWRGLYLNRDQTISLLDACNLVR